MWWPFQNLPGIVLKPGLWRFWCVLEGIMLLKDPITSKFEFCNKCHNIILEDLLVFDGIQITFGSWLLPSALGCKASQLHYWTTTIPYSWYGALIYICFGFLPLVLSAEPKDQPAQYWCHGSTEQNLKPFVAYLCDFGQTESNLSCVSWLAD